MEPMFTIDTFYQPRTIENEKEQQRIKTGNVVFNHLAASSFQSAHFLLIALLHLDVPISAVIYFFSNTFADIYPFCHSCTIFMPAFSLERCVCEYLEPKTPANTRLRLHSLCCARGSSSWQLT